MADEETAKIVAGCGITHMQGYLFGRPLLATDLPANTVTPGTGTFIRASTATG